MEKKINISYLFKRKIKEFFLCLLTIIPVLIFLGIYTDKFLYKLSGANTILCIISIFSYILYASVNYKLELYPYVLLVLNILIESISFQLLSTNYVYFPFTQALFRITILLIILYKSNLNYNILKENNHIILFFNILALILDIVFKFNTNKILYYIIIFISYLLIAKLLILSVLKMEFSKLMYILFLGVTTGKLFIYQDINISTIVHDQFLSFISFYILIAGFFVRIKYLIFSHNDLNKNVSNISNDIKEIKELETLRSEFFANISHEFKTPLNIIFSCIQLLESQKSKGADIVGEKYIQYEKNIKQNCYRMIRLTNNLVDLSKLDSGFLDISFFNYDIVELVENVVLSAAPYIESRNLNIVFDTSIEELTIKCDSRSIERIILNLLSNSIKFSNDNGNIFVNLDADDDYVKIEVIDDGIGINDTKKDFVFDLFVQCDKSLKRKKEGIGIGLSLVKSLVNIHEGIIYLDESIEKGTKIIIKLPNTAITDENSSSTKETASNSDDIISKINIEFSDIYDL